MKLVILFLFLFIFKYLGKKPITYNYFNLFLYRNQLYVQFLSNIKYIYIKLKLLKIKVDGEKENIMLTLEVHCKKKKIFLDRVHGKYNY